MKKIYFFGKVDKEKVATNVTNNLDKILDTIYIEANYNYERNMNNYFSYQKKIMKFMREL